MNLTGFGAEIVRFSHTQEIGSLAATRVQSCMPGHSGTRNKLIARVAFWPSKESLATLFYKVRESVLVADLWCSLMLHVVQKVH